MKYQLRIEISLKQGHSDPEGETTAGLLRELGYKVDDVKVSKGYSVVLDAKSREEAEVKAREICERLLANPTKDNYEIKVKKEEEL